MVAAAPDHAADRDLAKVRELVQAKEFAAGLASANRLLRSMPAHRELLYLIAVSQRCLGQAAEALETLARLEKHHPQFSRLFQERGLCCMTLGNPGAAIEAYLQAVNLNAALPASWQALEALFRSAGREPDAAMAAAHVAKLASLPPVIVRATSLFADGEIHAAESLVRDHLQSHAEDVEAMRLLAKIAIKLEILDDAEFLLESVLVFAPAYHPARFEYAGVLLQRHKPARALAEAEKLLLADPQNRNFRILHASACVAVGRYADGLRLYREIVAETPQGADLHLAIAHTLKTLGRPAEAIESYRRAAAIRPTFGDAYWSLANLKTYRFSDAEIAAMRHAENAVDTALADRYHLCFALGKAHEDRGEYAESWAAYARGNALKRSETRYRPEPVERVAKLQATVCTKEFFASRAGVGCPRPDPIFIVGLPRAGSTLLEQILASHSKVEGTRELADIPRLAARLQGRGRNDGKPRYPAVLGDLNPDQFRRFGEQYLADTAIYRHGKPFFIDKMPNNFRHIGLIHLILPNARIIDARREPMACCFGNFKQLFASGQEFTYGIDDIARYYRMYIELMDHWDAALPGRILRVQHEEVVENLEGSVRRLLDYCGLGFEPACLDFHATERSIRTASAEQVRRPLNRDGVEQWRHFEPWLGPLHAALAPLAAATTSQLESKMSLL